MMDDSRMVETNQQETDVMHGSYTISVEEEGIFICIHPPVGGGNPVKETAVIEELQSKAVSEFDRSALLRAVKEASGMAVKIAEVPKTVAEPEVQVIVTRDRMEAALTILRPSGSRELTMEEMIEAIKKSGVIFGLNQTAITQAYNNPGIRVVCANGQPQVDGADAKIKYHVDTENKGKPVEQEDGKVDFKNLNLFTIVQAGELLAEKIPATPGIPGIDVLGQPVFAKPGKDMPMPIGKNVQVIDHTNIVSMIAGQVQIVNNKISVVPVIEIKGDVDLSTGNIEFVGTVIVRGSVQAGFFIKAEGDVEIYGTVSGGTVEGKNVTIKMGIQGMHRGYIKASEDVFAKFIENATVYAGRDVVVSDVILHSRISAGKQVVVEGKRGLITGGTVMAAEEIRAKSVGTHMAISTELEVGVNPMLREEYQHIRREIKKVEVSLEQTQKALSILRSMNQSTMPQDKREMLLKLTKAQFHLVGQVENMRTRMKEIEAAFEEMRLGRIRVAEALYPGVKVVIGTIVKPIRETLKFVSLYAEDGEVKIGTFK